MTHTKEFYSRLQISLHDKTMAQNLIRDIRCLIKTTVKTKVKDTHGFTLHNVIFFSGQSNVVIISAYNDKFNGCAKVSSVGNIKDEFNIGKLVTGPCVMPIIDYFELDEPERIDKRAAIVIPLYIRTLADWLRDYPALVFPPEDEIVALILCGLSAVYSFASRFICHHDIKLENIMMSKKREFILIDFGAATDYDHPEGGSEFTPGYSFAHSTPSIQYDLNSLAITVARVIMNKRDKDLVDKNHLFQQLIKYQGRYPVAMHMMELLKPCIDVEMTISKLNDACIAVYEYASNANPWVKEYPHLKIGEIKLKKNQHDLKW